jgi:NitT/TauT family transport system permease protein
MSTTSLPPEKPKPTERGRGRSGPGPGTSAKKSLMSRRSPWRYIFQLMAIVLLFGSWELVVRLGIADPNFVSQPSAFFRAFWFGVTEGQLLQLMANTLYVTIVGFIVAAVLGLAAGLVLAEFETVDVVMRPIMNAFNSLPRVALAPLFVLWFGLGNLAAIALVISLGFFIVAFSTYAGLQSANRDLLLLARTLGTSRSVRFRKFVLPSASPAIFAGMQLNLTYAFLGAVVGQMLTGSQGLGGYFALTLNTFQTTEFFGALVLLALVAVSLASLMRGLERYLLRWRTHELAGTGPGT